MAPHYLNKPHRTEVNKTTIKTYLVYCSEQENGAELWNRWIEESWLKKPPPGSRADLSNFDFSGLNFSGYKFLNVNFDLSNFSQLKLNDCTIFNCSFNGATIENTEIIKSEVESSSFKGNVNDTGILPLFINCSGTTFKDVTFSGRNFGETCLDAVEFDECTLSGCDLSNAGIANQCFIGCTLKSVNLSGKDLRHLHFSEIGELSSSNFDGCIISNSDLGGCNLIFSSFVGADLRGAKFCNCDLKAASFRKAKLNYADFSGANVRGVIFKNADLTSSILENLNWKESSGNLEGKYTSFLEAKLINVNARLALFERCEFDGAELSGIELYKAKFIDCKFQGCKIDRHSLSFVESNEITPSDLMVMKITDDAAKLRLQFSGIWAFSHVFALAAFLFPYIWFILWHWPNANLDAIEDPRSIALWKALTLYIYNGGREMASGKYAFSWSFVIFLILLVYNVFRAVLLMKTIKLEHMHTITGMRPKFSFDESSFYGFMFKYSKLAFLIGLGLVFFNLYFFLQGKIQLSDL